MRLRVLNLVGLALVLLTHFPMLLCSPGHCPWLGGAGRAQRGRPVGRIAPAPGTNVVTTRPIRAAAHGQIAARFSG